MLFIPTGSWSHVCNFVFIVVVVFINGTFLIFKILITFKINVYIKILILN
jgi:hypothetical protein